MSGNDFLGAFERLGDAGANVAGANVLFELGLVHQARRLFPCAAKNEGSASAVDRVGEGFEGLQASGVNGGHISQAQNHDGWQIANARNDFFDFVGGSEEKRAVDPEDGDIRRNFLVLQNVGVAFADVFVGDLAYGGGGRDFADEKQRGENHSHFDGNREIGENGEQEGGQPDSNIETRELQEFGNFAPLAHVVGNDQEYSRQDRKRNKFCERRGEDNNRKEREGVNHARDRRFGSGADVRCGASDCSGGRQSAEKWREDVRYPLRDEFDIGVVLVSAHAV